MRELALRHGEPWWSATLIPLSVDGMVVAASMSVLLASRMGRRVSGCLGRFSSSGAWLVSRRTSGWRATCGESSDRCLAVFRVRRFVPLASRTIPDRSWHPRPTLGWVGGCSTGSRIGDGDEGPSCLEDPGRVLQRQAWEWALANRSEDGLLPAGAVIARRFNRSPRWWCLVKNTGAAGSLEPIAITADLYAEVVTELAREAAEKTAAMIPRNKARATRRSPHGPPRLGSVQRRAST
ncbi:DUF2637 domain-containing protein [Actinomadura sp. DC4]|uniref:DUF2637 domain-containing protein n=1 Tax=Actinomadura sp. DC4 TaxID=3055069 RepID=UPI0025B2236C|nr:DUF2637 domain-containing protein [Actinomadura sp. DC4]MDN3356831.1 DUF2637 domain-containing protein [Actinomadura sp. DC4]